VADRSRIDLVELVREAGRAIRAHTLRSFLTLLGIIIGVATLVGVVSVITGLNAYVREKVIALAPDVFVITKFGIIRSREEFLDAVKRRNIEWRDYEKLATVLTRADRVAAEAVTNTTVKFREHHLADVQVHGTTATYARMVGLDFASGRYFVEGEDQGAQYVAIVGWDIKDELYPQLDPVGRAVLVGNVPYRVIGLLAKQGRTLGQSRDSQIYVPIQTYRRSFGSRTSLNILVQAKGGIQGLGASVDEVRSVMRALRHTAFRAPDPFGLVTAESLQTLWAQISAAAFILSLLIASVSLGVGGIVIMNIMLVAVVERTREIGVRLALGARKRDIRRQFLMEAAFLSLAGGLAGVVLGSLVAMGVKGILDFPAQVTVPIVLAGIALSVGVGLAAGYWPARSASNLPVVDALRVE
jgi:putative ABC transport system permease protein